MASTDTLVRIMQIIRHRHFNKTKITNNDLRIVIEEVCGLDYRTYQKYRKALIRHKYIKSYKSKHVDLTDKDLTGIDPDKSNFIPPPPHPKAEDDFDEEYEEEPDLHKNKLWMA